jgi:hypothetical protein
MRVFASLKFLWRVLLEVFGFLLLLPKLLLLVFEIIKSAFIRSDSRQLVLVSAILSFFLILIVDSSHYLLAFFVILLWGSIIENELGVMELRVNSAIKQNKLPAENHKWIQYFDCFCSVFIGSLLGFLLVKALPLISYL